MDLAKVKDQARASWGMGEYGRLSEMLRPAAEALVEACAVSVGQEVLDVAAGDGNFALACAREGASVIASDLAPKMVERGRERALDEGYEIEWVEADAEELPFEGERFDCVGSVFGAMIAPRPRIVAQELFRVARPGGSVGMTAWMPDSAAVEMFKVGRSYAPPSDQPMIEEWGREEVVRERFEGLASSIEMDRRSLPWTADSPEDLVATMERAAPLQAAAKASMPEDEYARMRADLLEVVRGWAGGDGAFSVDWEYLLIVARRRG